MRLASVGLWAAFVASGAMSCAITDKINFEVVPPSLTVSSPPTITRRPSTSDECPDGMSFRASFFNAQLENDLVARVFVNHVLKDGFKIISTDTTGIAQFCVDFAELGGNGPNPQADCYEVELYASHSFLPYSRLDPAEPVVEGDYDSVTWYVGVPSSETAEEPVDLFEACANRGLDPLSPTSATLDGGTSP